MLQSMGSQRVGRKRALNSNPGVPPEQRSLEAWTAPGRKVVQRVSADAWV